MLDPTDATTQHIDPTDGPTVQLLTPDQFRLELQNVIGRRSIYGLLSAGRIKHLRVGRRILIPRSEVTGFAQRESEK